MKEITIISSQTIGAENMKTKYMKKSISIILLCATVQFGCQSFYSKGDCPKEYKNKYLLKQDLVRVHKEMRGNSEVIYELREFGGHISLCPIKGTTWGIYDADISYEGKKHGYVNLSNVVEVPFKTDQNAKNPTGTYEYKSKGWAKVLLLYIDRKKKESYIGYFWEENILNAQKKSGYLKATSYKGNDDLVLMNFKKREVELYDCAPDFTCVDDGVELLLLRYLGPKFPWEYAIGDL